MIDAVAESNRSRPFTERIPGKADARRKVSFICFVDVTAKWRSRGPAIESGGASLNILCVNNHAVAEVSASGAPVSSPCNDRSIGSLPKTGVEIGEDSVAILRRSEVRVANAETQRHIIAHTPLILPKPLER